MWWASSDGREWSDRWDGADWRAGADWREGAVWWEGADWWADADWWDGAAGRDGLAAREGLVLGETPGSWDRLALCDGLGSWTGPGFCAEAAFRGGGCLCAEPFGAVPFGAGPGCWGDDVRCAGGVLSVWGVLSAREVVSVRCAPCGGDDDGDGDEGEDDDGEAGADVRGDGSWADAADAADAAAVRPVAPASGRRRRPDCGGSIRR
ncbi:hypothetical protein [Streptomyces sp. enrichment culture]|uniref:hypothetical protein n=1 Tax=Streptomyces sp. enrichment culture TaxID=1795815 RepID=UPI003F5581EA